jgi:hypothetical protein
VDLPAVDDETASVLQRYKYEVAIIVLILITTLPLLTEPYFYYDDWWNIGNSSLVNKQTLVGFARPIQILFLGVFDKIGIRNAYLFKWVFLPALILYGIVLYRWLRSNSKNEVLSFLLASILCAFGPAMDLLGYTATSASAYSYLFSALSFVAFDLAYESRLHGGKVRLLARALLTFLLLLAALLTYQIGTQIVFVLMAIEVYFNSESKPPFAKYAWYLCLWVLSIACYLLLTKTLTGMYGVPITTNRSQIVGSLPGLVNKALFYLTVFEQSIMQVVTAFTGDSLILERYHGYFITFSHHTIGGILFLFVLIMLLVALLNYWLRAKNIIGLVCLLAFLPMSYYVFLVLQEDGYLTYYGFAQISLVMFYFLMGFIMTIQFMWNRIVVYTATPGIRAEVKPMYIATPLLVLCALVSNYYVRDFYINYNNTVYNFVKYSLQTAIESGNIKRIHVNGTISPINADVYSRFVVQTALTDLGKNASDYVITFSRNRYFLARIQAADYKKILEHLSEEDRQELAIIYTFDPTYGQYYTKIWPSADDQKKLQQIFMSAGIIPQSSSPDTLIIDLTWTDKAYYNNSK